MSGHLAQQTNFTSDDLELLWDAIENMFEYDRSASRGQMALRKLIVFEHNSVLGNAPAHKLFERIHVESVPDIPAREYTDYHITIDGDQLPERVAFI
ncbi:hypothetical protein D3C81_2141640 [compost metagenome]